jgi:hypothetical protein
VPSTPLKTAPQATSGSREASHRGPDLLALLEGGRDIRARRKPWVLQTLTAAATYRRMGRIIALLSLDLVGVFGAIWTALAVKAILRSDYHAHAVFSDATEFLAFAYLVTVLLFARAGL